MLTRIVLVFIGSMFVGLLSAQSDTSQVVWSIDFDLGYGTVLGSQGMPPPVFCFEGCTPLTSTGEYNAKRIGLLMKWNDENALSFSSVLVDYAFDRLYRDEFQGAIFGEEWKIQYIAAEVSYLRTMLSKKKWTGKGEIGASYYFNIKTSEGITAVPKNTINLFVGGRIEYQLSSHKALFSRIMVSHSLQNSLEYFADTASLDVDKFAPLSISLGINFHL